MKDYIACGPHHTFGWLRRTELDDDRNGFCYEAPCGDLIYSKQSEHEEMMMLFVILDEEGKTCLTDRRGLLTS